MLTLHTVHNLPPMLKGRVRDLRVTWALEELGLHYRIRWMDFAAMEHRAPENRSLSAFGKVPALDDDGRALFESAAIVLYLYEKAGRMPADAFARAHINKWCFAALNTVEPVLFEIVRWDYFWRDKPGREWRRPELIGLANERLSDLERELTDLDYLTGEFSAADIVMVHVLDFCGGMPELFADYRNIRAWLGRCHARPAYARAQALQGAGPKVDAA